MESPHGEVRYAYDDDSEVVGARSPRHEVSDSDEESIQSSTQDYCERTVVLLDPTTFENTDSDVSLGSDTTRVTRDVEFYNTDIILRVENRIFKVPRVYLEQGGSVFRAMFTLPQDQSEVPKGSSDDNPIVIDNISSLDFRRFLRALLCPLYFLENCVDMKSSDGWISALKLSTMWDFDGVRKRSIATLDSMQLEAVHKAVIALEYSIHGWFLPAYTALVERKEPLSVEEAKRLGLEVSINISRAREMGMQDPPLRPCACGQKRFTASSCAICRWTERARDSVGRVRDVFKLPR